MKDLTDFNTTTSNNVGEVVSNVDGKIKAILEGATTQFTKGGFLGIGATGFTGIDEKGLKELQDKINQYCNDVQGVVQLFKEDANISGAFKGSVSSSIQSFVRGTKSLINNFVSNVRQEAVEADQLFKAYREGTKDIQANVSTGAAEIRKNAVSVFFDKSGGN